MRPARLGVVGCGFISGVYFQNLLKFEAVDVVACADPNPELAAAVAQVNPGVQAMTTGELLADSSINLILNPTQPKYHFEVMKAGIEAGRHVYGEKPLSVSFEDSVELMALARRRTAHRLPTRYVPPLLQLPPTARWHRRGCTHIKTVNNVCGNYT